MHGDGVAIPSDGVISYKRRRQDFQDDEISAMIDSRLENIVPAHIPIQPPVLFEQLLDDFMNPPDELVMDDSKSDTKSYETPLISPFLDSDDESDDREVINELNEYGNT
ncbi:hypothetical protein Tco_0684204 [Tanacetum coccineum]